MKMLALTLLLLAAAPTAYAQQQRGTAIPVPTDAAPAQLPPAAPAGVRMCSADDLTLNTDDENGAFDGMSHSGTLLVLRNLSPTACRVPAIPQIAFADGSGPLKATISTPGFGRQPNGVMLGHGPVVLPVVIASGAEVTSKLRWVSNEVYDKNVCIQPTKLTVLIEGKPQTTDVDFQLCGDASAAGVTYEATHLAPDPVYTPGK